MLLLHCGFSSLGPRRYSLQACAELVRARLVAGVELVLTDLDAAGGRLEGDGRLERLDLVAGGDVRETPHEPRGHGGQVHAVPNHDLQQRAIKIIRTNRLQNAIWNAKSYAF